MESIVRLRQITAPISNELKTFERSFKTAMQSQVGLVDIITRYIIRQKGKRVRPILVLLTAAACGGINERSYRGAILVELLHTATLVHDDVVDGSMVRRGLASINAIWKNKISVLMGDFLLSRGLIVAMSNGDYDFLETTTEAVRRMSEAELLQIQKMRKFQIDEETYFRIISDKTAALLSTCCEIGAASATDDPELRSQMKQYGENIGIAFQIQDDLFDYIGKESTVGKPVGADMKEKKLTLPLIHAMNAAPRKEVRAVLRLMKNGLPKSDIRKIVEFVEAYQGIAYARQRAEEYIARARKNLACLDPSPVKTSLEDITHFVIQRTR